MSGKPRPRVTGSFDEAEVRDHGGRLIRLVASTRWRVSCACVPDRYIAVVPSWEGARDVALLHAELLHGKRAADA